MILELRNLVVGGLEGVILIVFTCPFYEAKRAIDPEKLVNF